MGCHIDTRRVQIAGLSVAEYFYGSASSGNPVRGVERFTFGFYIPSDLDCIPNCLLEIIRLSIGPLQSRRDVER
jgi:hypothetical protein